MSKIIACIFLSLSLFGCQTLSKQNINANQKNIKQQATKKIIDSYQFFEKEGDLFFVLSLKNNTTEAIEISSGIKPFNIYRQNYESVESRYITPSPGPIRRMIVIAPHESHDFEYKVNDIYRLDEGEHYYNFIYFYGKDYTYDEVVEYGYKKLARDLTILSFTWFKEPNSRKGKLISYDVKDK